MNDVQIAKSIPLEKISKVAKKFGIEEEQIIPYGKYKAKLDSTIQEKIQGNQNGKLILVTSINPTPLGEGKTTISIGLSDAINKIREKIDFSIKRAFFRTCFWYERWSNRWRICSNSSNG